jgi:hypothetical protein
VADFTDKEVLEAIMQMEKNKALGLYVFRAEFYPFQVFRGTYSLPKIKNGVWKPIEDRFERKLESWIGKLQSYGDQIILINPVFTSHPMFMLTFLEILKGVRKILDYFLSHFFFCQSDGHKGQM